MSELRELFEKFEKLNDIPDHITRCGNSYVSSIYNDWSGITSRFEGFKQGYEAAKASELAPEGFKFVPIAPTTEQQAVAAFNLCNEFDNKLVSKSRDICLAAYRELVEAAKGPNE